MCTYVTKQLWRQVAKDMKAKLPKNPPTADQCIEKFYSLKRGYRKYLSETCNTGNKRPRPFVYEEQMEEQLRDDPAFKPLVVKSSLGREEINNNSQNKADSDDDDDDVNNIKTAGTRGATVTGCAPVVSFS